jgi:hypothetical protein
MNSHTRWIAVVALLCTASVSHAQSITSSYFRTVYDVETAEALPDVGYRVEYRYLPGYGAPGWHTHATYYNYQDAQQSLIWVLLHMVVEGRIVEFTPPATMLQWERVATYDTVYAADHHASQLAEPGLLTRVTPRQVPRFVIPTRPQIQLP